MHISVGISQILTIDQLFIYYSRINERIRGLLVVAVNNKPSVLPTTCTVPSLHHDLKFDQGEGWGVKYVLILSLTHL